MKIIEANIEVSITREDKSGTKYIMKLPNPDENELFNKLMILMENMYQEKVKKGE